MRIDQQGIEVTPDIIKAGDLVRIQYNGLLAQSGADQVYVHVGYGDRWEYVSDYPMQKTANGWQKVLSVEHPGSLNFCFKDSANNWDNNNGLNWSVSINNNLRA